MKTNFFFTFFELFLAFFSTLPSAQAIKVIGLIFFNELALKNWALNMNFNPLSILSDLFLGRGAWDAPPQFKDRPPAF